MEQRVCVYICVCVAGISGGGGALGAGGGALGVGGTALGGGGLGGFGMGLGGGGMLNQQNKGLTLG